MNWNIRNRRVYIFHWTTFVWIYFSFFDWTYGRTQYLFQRPSNATVHLGQNVVLLCAVGNQAAPGRTHWTKDDVVLGFDYDLKAYDRYRVTGDHNRGEYHLEIADAQLDDDAYYECQVQPAPGEEGLRAGAHVDVIVPPDSVTFDGYTSGSKLEILSGQPVDVTCRSGGGKPAPEIQWYKTENGRSSALPELSVQEHHERLQDGRISVTSRLHLSVGDEDSGSMFTCQVRHKAFGPSHTLRANFTLSVIYPPGQPTIYGYDGGTLKAGDRLNLQCKVRNGNPHPQLVWFRNEKMIYPSYTNNAEETLNDYFFSVDASDNGAQYRCEASNAATVSPLSAAVVLKVIYPPAKATIVGPDEAKIGDNVEFKCETSESNPPAKISWAINGRSLDGHPRLKIHGLRSTSTINLKIGQDKRDTLVECTAVNEDFQRGSNSNDGQVRDEKVVRVHYPPESVGIYGYNNKAIAAGTSIVLTCLATGGSPKAELTWYKGERRLTQGVSDPSLTESNSQRTLTITASREDNGADYRCLATNAATAVPLEDRTKLTVAFPPDKLTITVSPEKLTAGQKADFVCETGPGNPAAVITWLRLDSSEILASQDVYNRSGAYGGWEVKNRMRLVLTPEDEGARFRCSATSPAMNSSNMTADTTVTVHFKPIFSLTNPQEMHVLENEFVTLNAYAQGNPRVTRYEWSKDGVPVSRLERGQSQFFVSGSNLNISNVDKRDAGSFVCTAHNDEGSTTLVFRLSVKYPAQILDVSNYRVYADEGKNAHFECEAVGNPKPTIRWERKNFPEIRMKAKSSDSKSYLQVIDVRQEDVGDFTCVASNDVGEPSRKTVLLLVKRPPQIDRNKIYLKTAPRGRDAQLVCVADGVPDVRFGWVKETVAGQVPIGHFNNMMEESDRLSETRFKSTLNVRNVAEDNYGMYTCIAENSYPATDTLTIVLNKTSGPEIPSLLPVVNVTHDSAVIQWSPGFDGGLSQSFRIQYYALGASIIPLNLTVPDSDATSAVVTNLVPNTKYQFYVEAYNNYNRSGFSRNSVEIQTLEAPAVSQQSLEEEIPILIIVLVSLVGILLLALNVVLIFCFIRRHQRKKLQALDKRKMLENKTVPSSDGSSKSTSPEKAAAARLVEPVGRKIQMYSSDASGGAVMRPESTDSEPRPRSGYSEDETSMRTVIEVDSSGQPVFVEHVSPSSHATYLLDDRPISYNDGPSNAMYAEALRTNSLQRHLAGGGLYNSNNPGYHDPKKLLYTQLAGVSSSSDETVPPAMGPLRSISQELNNYAPAYAHYNPPPPATGSKNALVRRYSPPNQNRSSHHVNSIPTLVQQTSTNGRMPYNTEVRPILTHQHQNGGLTAGHHAPVGQQGQNGSPVLSTFAPQRNGCGAKPDFLDLDEIPGDLV